MLKWVEVCRSNSVRDVERLAQSRKSAATGEVTPEVVLRSFRLAF